MFGGQVLPDIQTRAAGCGSRFDTPLPWGGLIPVDCQGPDRRSSRPVADFPLLAMSACGHVLNCIDAGARDSRSIRRISGYPHRPGTEAGIGMPGKTTQ